MTRAKRGFGSVRFVLVGMIAIGALTIAGCGGDSGSSSTGLTSSSGTASSGTASSGAASSGAADSGTGPSGESAAPADPAPPADAGASATPPPATPTPAPSTPAAVNLQWSAPTENSDGTPLTDLKGYKIHYGTQSQNYTGSISVDNPTVTTYLVDSLPTGTYYFAVTAYNASGAESSLSDEVQRALN